MTSNSKALVCGGGISGIITALHCHKIGLDCEIHETSNSIGGILQDWKVDGDWYFRNCQYLPADANWFGLLPKRELYSFPLSYGSYTDLFGKTCVFKGFSGPVYPGPAFTEGLRYVNGDSLADRLNAYPDFIAEPLVKWVERTGLCPKKLHHSNALGLMISRTYPLLSAEYIYSLKAKDERANNLYGLPRNQLGLSSPYSVLPRLGYTRYFNELALSEEGKNISITTKSTVMAREITGSENQASDGLMSQFFIWTGDPSPLLRHLKHYSLDSPTLRMRNIVMKWSGRYLAEPFYIQVYSQYSPITRIFIYHNKVTVECFDNDVPMKTVLLDCLDIMQAFLGSLEAPDCYYEFKEKRHSLLSLRDYEILEDFAMNPPLPNLIASPWHQYARTSKIDHIINAIDCLKQES